VTQGFNVIQKRSGPWKLEFQRFFLIFPRFEFYFKIYKSDQILIKITEKLTKKPFEWVYICWTKSKQNLRYLLPKLALPKPKRANIFFKVFNLNVGTRESGGNMDFYVMIFSHLGHWLLNKKRGSQDLEESVFGFLTTLLPTVGSLVQLASFCRNAGYLYISRLCKHQF
jgi:hypothetical protein